MTEQSQGPATDRENDPVIDPTKNVLDLVHAAMQRQDDLLEAGFRRQDDLRQQESLHLREMLALRTEMYDKLRLAESHRLDDVRTVDAAAVQRAQEVQTAQATALAQAVTTAAAAARENLDTALAPLNSAIADLRQAQYQAQGQKNQVVESRSSSGSVGMWLGFAVAGVALLFSALTVFGP